MVETIYLLCATKSVGLAALETKASKPPLMAKTGMYQTHAAKTLGALVDRYCGGSSICRTIDMYAEPNVTMTMAIENWIFNSEVMVTDAVRMAAERRSIALLLA